SGRPDLESLAGEKLVAKGKRLADFNWRLLQSVGFWALLLATTAIAARAVSRLVLTDPHFTLDRDAGVALNSPDFTIIGLALPSRARVTQVFQNDFGRNIF